MKSATCAASALLGQSKTTPVWRSTSRRNSESSCSRMVLVAIDLCIGPFPKAQQENSDANHYQIGTFAGKNEFVLPAAAARLAHRHHPAPQRPGTGFRRSPVPPAEPPRSTLFPATKNAASPHGCAASCCEWFQSVRVPEPTDCRSEEHTS